MMRFLTPIPGVVDFLHLKGWSWQEVRDDLLNYEVVTPDVNGGKDLFAYGAKYVGRVMRDLRTAADSGEFYLYRVYLREHADPNTASRVVGIEHARSMRRSSGGIGNVWPSSWDELVKIIEAQPGLRVLQTSAHQHVLRDGKIISTLPSSASEYRGLLNACRELRKVGVDCRRPHMIQRKRA